MSLCFLFCEIRMLMVNTDFIGALYWVCVCVCLVKKITSPKIESLMWRPHVSTPKLNTWPDYSFSPLGVWPLDCQHSDIHRWAVSIPLRRATLSKTMPSLLMVPCFPPLLYIQTPFFSSAHRGSPCSLDGMLPDSWVIQWSQFDLWNYSAEFLSFHNLHTLNVSATGVFLLLSLRRGCFAVKLGTERLWWSWGERTEFGFGQTCPLKAFLQG